MKKLLPVLFFIFLSVACEKEAAPGEPLIQYHFIDLTDEAGVNLFESNQISTADFRYISGDYTFTWEQIMEDNEVKIAGMHDKEFQQTVAKLRTENPFLLVETFQGERERAVSINGTKHTLRMSPLQDGFYQNGKLLEHSTDTVENWVLYVHHIVLEEY